MEALHRHTGRGYLHVFLLVCVGKCRIAMTKTSRSEHQDDASKRYEQISASLEKTALHCFEHPITYIPQIDIAPRTQLSP